MKTIPDENNMFPDLKCRFELTPYKDDEDEAIDPMEFQDDPSQIYFKNIKITIKGMKE